MKRVILALASAAALLAAGAGWAADGSVRVNRTRNTSGAEPNTVVKYAASDGSSSTVLQHASSTSRIEVRQADGSSAEAPGSANVSALVTDHASGGATVYVHQKQNEGAYDQNISAIQWDVGAYNSHIAVRQSGGENVSGVLTKNAENSLTDVRQMGGRNRSAVIQDFPRGSQAFVDQTGTGGANTVVIQQIGSGWPPTESRRRDYGMGQRARAYQYGGENASNIFQTGEGSDVVPPQNAAASDQIGDRLFSYILQFGSGNRVDVVQRGADQESWIHQSGSRNASYVEQTGADNESSIRQSGDDNRAEVRQTGDGAPRR